jgi:hypothetical protein
MPNTNPRSIWADIAPLSSINGCQSQSADWVFAFLKFCEIGIVGFQPGGTAKEIAIWSAKLVQDRDKEELFVFAYFE